MRLCKRRLVFGIISLFILLTLSFYPSISQINIRIDKIENYKFIDLNTKNEIFEIQNFDNIEKSYNFEYFKIIDCSCYHNNENDWYPRILCIFLFLKIGILNVRINWLELLYRIVRFRVILNNILDLLDVKSGLLNLMEVFNCPKIPRN
jgi:hypothetical protein